MWLTAQIILAVVSTIIAIVALIYSYHARMRINSKIKTMQEAVTTINTAMHKVALKADEFSLAVIGFREDVRMLQEITEEEVKEAKKNQIIN